ncbi:MAG TPA: class I SAM-dependent methyltransferase [Terriglobia bacterium]|nr:class I SAM-dependent methyltransferase [Terriglobia bacterium]
MGLIPEEIERHYQQVVEAERLAAEQGELERLRTQQILARELPPPPAVIFDVGGAAGVYAIPLAKQGYQVHLIDPVERHLRQARAGAEAARVVLASIVRGDARKLEVRAGTADAVLLLGPLYHLVEQSDRMVALREALRILKPGGILVAAAISRFASLIDGVSRGFFKDPVFRKIVAGDLASGQHRNPTENAHYFTTAFFHHPEQLDAEVREAGFEEVQVLAVEGPIWSAAQFSQTWRDPVQRRELMEFLALVEREPSVLGASAHLLAVGRA